MYTGFVPLDPSFRGARMPRATNWQIFFFSPFDTILPFLIPISLRQIPGAMLVTRTGKVEI